MDGTVSSYNEKEGFGFIRDPDGGEVLVDRGSVDGDAPLREGQRVEFEAVQTSKGREARDVRVVG